MNPQTGWFAVARAVLELLYFASGVGILAAACYGLKQLKLTRDIADANSKREAVKLAAVQCRYFAEQAVPALNDMFVEYRKSRLTFLAPQQQQPAFVLKEGEFVQAKYDIKVIQAEWPIVADAVVRYLKIVESFAIPFAAGVAADDIGFQETAAAFCLGVSSCMPAIFYVRLTQSVRFPSALALFCVWNNRIAAQAMAPFMKSMQEMINAADKDKIKPI